MDLIELCTSVNNFIALPSTFIFFGTAVILTLKTKFIQVRAFKKIGTLIAQNMLHSNITSVNTINPFHALFTAMASTIGMGNIVGPTVAIVAGGPGALFWLILYMIFGAATKFTEVTFALYSRKQSANGEILGGPTQYLQLVHPLVAKWYGFITLFLFIGWSGLQANTLGKILEQENVPNWLTGLTLAVILLIILMGGIKRVGSFASKFVPIMFILYLSFSLFIIFKDITTLKNAFHLIFSNIFTPASAMGGFLGASIFEAMRHGTYRGIFITEAGIGTSSIPHSLSEIKVPTDQGVLAIFGMGAEIFLSLMSGLVVLVSGVWLTVTPGVLTNTLIYDAFKMQAPVYGKWILILSITLFVLTTVIGNSFNGSQSFASFSKYRGLKFYYLCAAIATFLGSISTIKLIWNIMDIFLSLVAIPNLIGLLILAFKYSNVIDMK